jgi:hypothetical protein
VNAGDTKLNERPVGRSQQGRIDAVELDRLRRVLIEIGVPADVDHA